MLKVTIDGGNKTTKVKSNEMEFQFDSKVAFKVRDRFDMPSINSTNDFHLVVDNAAYEVGRNAYNVGIASEPVMGDSKLHNDYFVRVVTAMAKIIAITNEDELEVNLMVPYSTFKQEAKKIKEMFQRDFEVEFNGKKLEFSVPVVRVTVEGLAILRKEGKDGDCVLVDVGGGTTHILTWREGSFVDRLSTTIPHGAESDLTPAQIAQLVKNHLKVKGNGTKEKVILVGGISDVLEKEFEEYITKVITVATTIIGGSNSFANVITTHEAINGGK